MKAAPVTKAAPAKRQSFLGVFSFVLSLYDLYSVLMMFLFFSSSGLFGRFQFGNGMDLGALVSKSGLFFCGGTALLAFFSLLLKDRKKGLGAFALAASLVCFFVLLLRPF